LKVNALRFGFIQNPFALTMLTFTGTMENQAQPDDPTPAGFFRLEEIQALQTFEKQQLAAVNYFIWHNQPKAGEMPHRFLYALELAFDSGNSLLLSSGEDSEAVQILKAENLLETAEKLQRLHGKKIIQRIPASVQPLWRQVVEKNLENILLSRNEAGLYLNDSILLDFGEHRILIRLAEKEGLLAGAF
jgi:hypothetical protein